MKLLNFFYRFLVYNNYIELILLKSSSAIYFFSSTEPTEEGNYWHYDTDGKTPIIW